MYDIPEEIRTDTLWKDRKPDEFLTTCEAMSFKIVQIGKGKRKLVAYFENWEALRTAIETVQVFHPVRKELKWCRHSTPNLKKSPKKTRNIQVDMSKKKDKKSSNQRAKPNNQLKDPRNQKLKTANSKKIKGGKGDNKEVLAEILSLLRKLV